MPVSRARQRRAIITASAVLLLAAVGTARANDDFYRHHSREHAGKSRVYGNSAVHRHTPRHTHSRLNLHRSSNDPWARRWSRVHDEQQRFEPYGQGYYSLYTRSRDPYRYGYYGSHYDLSLYERFYLDRYLGAGSCGPIVSSAACSLPPADTLDPVHRSGAPVLRLHRARAFEPSFSLEAELIEIYEASGWTPLSDGRADDALRRFANLVERSPNRGVPRVGLALATAEIGDRARGAELMREARR